MKNFVSIIVPFNNGKDYLVRCLENLSKINYRDYEIILIDDFSKDNSELIAKNYPKVKYYHTNQQTIGVGNARNLGIEKATGNYIMFVDVDDLINENLLQNMEIYMNQGIEMIKYKMKIISRDNEISTKGATFEKTNGQDGFNKLYFNDIYLDSPCVYLIKKDFLNRIGLRFEKNMYHEDFGLIPQLIVNAESIISTDFYGYKYIQSKNSIMRNNDYLKTLKKVEDKIQYYKILQINIVKYNLSSQTHENLRNYYINSIILSIKDLDYADRKIYEKKIKRMGMIGNIKTRNFKQAIKKILLIANMEIYYRIK